MQLRSFQMTNMTSEPDAYYTNSEGGLVSADQLNSTEELVKISGVKKNNSVMNSSIMFAFGFFGNILALIVLKRSEPEHKRKLFYRLVAGLAATDLIGTTATSPVVISVYLNDFKWLGGDPLCKYFAYMMVFACFSTMIIVCIMAIERLLCVRYPYLYYAKLRKKHATIILCVAWFVAAFIAALPLIGFGNIVLQYPYTWCFIDYYTENLVDRAFNCVFASLAILLLSVTVGCNFAVLLTLIRTKMRVNFRRKRGDSRQFAGYSKRYAECQMVVLLIGITFVFSTCYLPLMVRILINQTKLLPVNLRTDLLMIRFASMNQILDPWVYILLRREIVWKVVSTLKKIFCCKTDGELTQDLENQRQSGFVSPSATSTSSETPTCCAFCWHCMCDPPQSVRQSSISNFYNEFSRKSLSHRSPTRKHLIDLVETVTNPGSSASASLEQSPVFKLKNVEHLKEKASTDLTLTQPLSIHRGKTKGILKNGSIRACQSDSQLCTKLLDDQPNGVQNGKLI